MNDVVQTKVTTKFDKVLPVMLARLGVSDTLYVDFAGNLLMKREATPDKRENNVPYDAAGASYRVTEMASAKPSAFYTSNKSLIDIAQSVAADAQKASPLELIQ